MKNDYSEYEDKNDELKRIIRGMINGESINLPKYVDLYVFILWNHEMNFLTFSTGILPSYQTIGIQKVRFQIPEGLTRETLINQQVNVLKAKQAEILGEARAKADNIQQTIQSLLALEHQKQ